VFVRCCEKRYDECSSNPNLSQIMLDLACLLILQEIFPQSAVVTDTSLLREFPCETNILRDIGANLSNLRVKSMTTMVVAVRA